MHYIQTRAFTTYRNDDPLHRVVESVSEFWDVIRWLEKHDVVVVDTETSGTAYYKHARICGVSMAAWDGLTIRCWYFPFRHQTGEEQLPEDVVLSGVRIILENTRIQKILHNAKFDEHMFHADGMFLLGPRRDTMAEASFWNENELLALKERAQIDLGDSRAHAMEDSLDREVTRQAKELGMGKEAYREAFGYSRIPINLCGPYAAWDVDFTGRLAKFYDEKQVTSYFAPLLATEYALTEVLCEMEENGLPVDVAYFRWLAGRMDQELEQLRPQIVHSLGGHVINPDSDEEVTEVMLKKLGIPLYKHTTGSEKKFRKSRNHADLVFSVDAEVMEEFSDLHPFCALMLQWRDASKIRGTYTESIISRTDAKGILHGDIKQFGTNCMPAGQLVLTSRGYLPVEQVAVGDSVITHMGRVRKVVTAEPNGCAHIYRVVLSNGLTLETTGNHAYRIPEGFGWIEAQRLKSGEKVVVHSAPEEWRKIPEWPDYRVSSWGRVWNDKSDSPMTQWPKGRWGHLKVMLCRNGAKQRGPDRRDFSVHRLVALTFLNAVAGKSEVRHLDGIAWNNTVGNLVWGSSLENRRDAVAHGTMSRRHGGQARITDEQAQIARGTSREEFSDERLAGMFDVSRELIRDVRLGKRWLPKEVVDEKKTVFTTATVVSVSRLSVAPVFGLTVEEDHSHVTGGIVTHNTGRMSSEKPNLQNFKGDSNERAKLFTGKSLEEGGHDPWSIKRGFINRHPDWMREYFDYSQVELRVLAELSGDPVMLDVYAKNEDIHSRTSMEVFGSAEKVFRRDAKIINFGLVYCMGAAGYARKAKKTVEQGEKDMAIFFTKYPRIAPFRQEVFAWARAQGNQFQNPFGRPRRIPGLVNRSSQTGMFTREERQTIGSLIQGTAAELTKAAMVRIHRYKRATGAPLLLCSTIHDEVSMDVEKRYARDIARAVVPMMEDFRSIFRRVPILVDAEYSDTNWSEKKKFPKEFLDDVHVASTAHAA